MQNFKTTGHLEVVENLTTRFHYTLHAYLFTDKAIKSVIKMKHPSIHEMFERKSH